MVKKAITNHGYSMKPLITSAELLLPRHADRHRRLQPPADSEPPASGPTARRSTSRLPRATRRTLTNITRCCRRRGRYHGKTSSAPPATLRDIDRDYAAFNEERTAFFQEQELDPLPASTAFRRNLCRPELLVEIEAIAIFRSQPAV